jgi:hypothetical protein
MSFNFENETDCLNYIQQYSMLTPKTNVSFKRIVTFKQKKLILVQSRLSNEEFLSLKSGYGGRVGVIPYMMVNDQPHFFVGFSNANLFSDFGGGCKIAETPFDGIVRELSEECCEEWKRYFENKIGKGKCSGKDVIFFNEYLFPEETREKRGGICYKIIILCEIDEKTANTFKKTDEIVNCDLYNKEKLVQLLRRPYNEHLPYINSGLIQLREYYNDLVECM